MDIALLHFKLVNPLTNETIGYEYLTEQGWRHDVFDLGEREGVFDERELGDGFMGFIRRYMWTGKTLDNGQKLFVGDEITPGNRVEFSFDCFNVNGDYPLSRFKYLFRV